MDHDVVAGVDVGEQLGGDFAAGAGGIDEAGGLIVVYRVYTDPGNVPLGLTGVAQRVAKNKIPDGIVSLRERIRTVFLPAAK